MSRLPHYFRSARTIVMPSFWCLTTAVLINDKALEVVSVNGPSMHPSLSPTYHETGDRDYLLLRKWDPTRNLKRGDVVSFYTPHKPDTLGIKRVVGVEGDWVELDSRRRPENEGVGGGVDKAEVWDLMGQMHNQRGTGSDSNSKRRVMVPPGHVWVEGDNWRMSKDSNAYGPISKSLINGKAVCVVLPFNRFGTKPWESFKGKTKVKQSQAARTIAWDDL